MQMIQIPEKSMLIQRESPITQKPNLSLAVWNFQF